MVRGIDFDEETDRILAELAQDYGGNLSKAITELIHAHKSLEAFVEQTEEIHKDSLLAQVRRSEQDFREGRSISWQEVKRRNDL